MRDLALDPVTGDLALVEGRASLTSGVEAVLQKLRIRLSLWKGEWFADTSVGVPFLRFLGVKGAEGLAETVLRRAIATCPGVASLESFALALVGRRATVTFRARTTSGEPVDVQDFTFAEAA